MIANYTSGYSALPPILAPQQQPLAKLSAPQGALRVNSPTLVANTPELQAALKLLGSIQHLPADEAYLRQLGVDPIFQNGAQALQLIQQKGIRVEFERLAGNWHAEWQADKHRIVVNKKYQGDLSVPTLYGLAAAIYHEAGHAARLGDNEASVQEEINCLGLNVLAHRYFMATQPSYQFASSQSKLITDGVALYSNLFFSPDPTKHRLIQRIYSKYGQLPPESRDHLMPRTPTATLLQAVMGVKQAMANPRVQMAAAAPLSA
ncbi:MAG: hypothetical protein VKK59_07095 [Vampirovibrionales bacterium]|nr:hypothetical protein [Vampirovibrionales bacterium]